MTGAGLGAYVHVPFCAARCDYCAFATWTDRAHLVDDYVRAVCREIAGARASGLLGRPATAYVGGGTPSLLGATRLAEILAAVAPAPGAEVTVECNPEDVDAPLLEALHAAGVTRVSLGVQSLVPHVLAGLGRRGVPERSLAALALVGAAGFASFSVDLIYGGPGERAEDLERTLDLLLDADAAPPHLSAYALSVEPGTPLARDPARHPDDDVLAERYERLDEVLAAAGYRWYEVSNWARPGHECRHNENYWAQATTSASARRRTATSGAGASTTSSRSTATSSASRPGARRSPPRCAAATPSASSSGSSSRSAPAPASRRRRCATTPRSATSSSAAATGSSSPGRVASSRARSASVCRYRRRHEAWRSRRNDAMRGHETREPCYAKWR